MSSRKVQSVWFHTSIPIPGIPDLQMQAGGTKTPGVEMLLTELGLEVKKGRVCAFIPVVNIKSVLFEDSNGPDSKAPSTRLR